MTASPTELDLRGLKCPLPVLRTRKALRGLADGDTLVVLCTDPMATIDLPHFARTEGHTVVSQAFVDGIGRFVLIKGDCRKQA